MYRGIPGIRKVLSGAQIKDALLGSAHFNLPAGSRIQIISTIIESDLVASLDQSGYRIITRIVHGGASSYRAPGNYATVPDQIT